jgi:hypothetical protein
MEIPKIIPGPKAAWRFASRRSSNCSRGACANVRPFLIEFHRKGKAAREWEERD